MKTRNGFVSNSSTTSFCIMGISFEKNSVVNPKNFPQPFPKKPLRLFHWYDADMYYLGVGVENMGEDETVGQFRKRVQEILDESLKDCSPEILYALKDSREASWIVEAWRDG